MTTQIYSHYAPSEHEVQVVNDAFAPDPAGESLKTIFKRPIRALERGRASAPRRPSRVEAPGGPTDATGNNPGNKLSESESN